MKPIYPPAHEPLKLTTARFGSPLLVGARPFGFDRDGNTSADTTRSADRRLGIVQRPSDHTGIKSPDNPRSQDSIRIQEQTSHGKLAIVWPRGADLVAPSFEVLQRFDGTVISVTSEAFVSRLSDRTNPGVEEEAEIPLAEIMPGDLELVKPGAMFYWVIGYRREVYGQVSRSSVIRFKRLPSWSPEDVDRAKKSAETLLSFFDLDRANHPA